MSVAKSYLKTYLQSIYRLIITIEELEQRYYVSEWKFPIAKERGQEEGYDMGCIGGTNSRLSLHRSMGGRGRRVGEVLQS